MTIVGVSTDIRQRVLQEFEPDPVVYLPHWTDSSRSSILILRTQSDLADVAAIVRDTLRRIEPAISAGNRYP